MNPFSPLIRFKVMYWRTKAWMLYHHRFVWYVIGIIMGWLVCSEYQVYLETGVWTTHPWE